MPGIIYFIITKDGDILDADYLFDNEDERDMLHDKITTYLNKAGFKDFQVELNAYGFLIDYADEKAPELADYTFDSYTITFEASNNNNNNNNNNMNGGARKGRKATRKGRKATRKGRKTHK